MATFILTWVLYAQVMAMVLVLFGLTMANFSHHESRAQALEKAGWANIGSSTVIMLGIYLS